MPKIFDPAASDDAVTPLAPNPTVGRRLSYALRGVGASALLMGMFALLALDLGAACLPEFTNALFSEFQADVVGHDFRCRSADWYDPPPE